MINKVTLIGRLGADPEVKTLESGATVAKFGLATSESYKDKQGEWQEQTEWHDIVCWRQLAERSERLQKGQMVYLEGKLTHRKWTDKDGNPRKTTEVVANYFRSMSKPEGSANSAQTTAPASNGMPKVDTEEKLPF